MSTAADGPGTVVVLAAGRGTRLGGATPKPLTPVGADGETIIARQLRLMSPLAEHGWRTLVVVGHERGALERALPGVDVVVNRRYAETNTARSLLCALQAAPPGPVLWLNGDVVFSPEFADAVRAWVLASGPTTNLVGVVRGTTAEEEVKFLLDDAGCLRALSKQVVGGLGEAIGVNAVGSASRGALAESLAACDDQDYFERGIEVLLERGAPWLPMDLTGHFAVEVDFPADLARALAHVGTPTRAGAR